MPSAALRTSGRASWTRQTVTGAPPGYRPRRTWSPSGAAVYCSHEWQQRQAVDSMLSEALKLEPGEHVYVAARAQVQPGCSSAGTRRSPTARSHRQSTAAQHVTASVAWPMRIPASWIWPWLDARTVAELPGATAGGIFQIASDIYRAGPACAPRRSTCRPGRWNGFLTCTLTSPGRGCEARCIMLELEDSMPR